jgi:hypothetical protein
MSSTETKRNIPKRRQICFALSSVDTERNNRNIPLKGEAKVFRPSRARLTTGSLRLRCAPPGRCAASRPTQFAAVLPNSTRQA